MKSNNGDKGWMLGLKLWLKLRCGRGYNCCGLMQPNNYNQCALQSQPDVIAAANAIKMLQLHYMVAIHTFSLKHWRV